MTTPATPVEPRTAVMRLTLLDGSTWTDKGIRDFAAYLGQQFEMRAEPEAAGVLLREALERLLAANEEPTTQDEWLAAQEQALAALAAAAPTVEPPPEPTPVERPWTKAGREMVEWFEFTRRRTGWVGIPTAKEVADIETQAIAAEPQRAAAGPRTSERCQSCGSPYDEVWGATGDLWRDVTGIEDGSGLRCMTCFSEDAAGKHIPISWIAVDGTTPRIEAEAAEQSVPLDDPLALAKRIEAILLEPSVKTYWLGYNFPDEGRASGLAAAIVAHLPARPADTALREALDKWCQTIAFRHGPIDRMDQRLYDAWLAAAAAAEKEPDGR